MYTCIPVLKPIKVMQKLPKFQPILAELGREWEVTDELFAGLEEFTCAIYGQPRFESIYNLASGSPSSKRSVAMIIIWTLVAIWTMPCYHLVVECCKRIFVELTIRLL